MKYSKEYFSFPQQDSLVLDYKPHAKSFVASIWKNICLNDYYTCILIILTRY